MCENCLRLEDELMRTHERAVAMLDRAERNARLGRNPRTGEKVKVASRKAIYYRAGKELKELVNS